MWEMEPESSVFVSIPFNMCTAAGLMLAFTDPPFPPFPPPQAPSEQHRGLCTFLFVCHARAHGTSEARGPRTTTKQAQELPTHPILKWNLPGHPAQPQNGVQLAMEKAAEEQGGT